MPAKKKKEQESKKAVQKKKNQAIEDKTFGLKNKNKSKKIQAYVKGVEKSVLHDGKDSKARLQEQQRKIALKERKKAAKAEQDALFGEALLAVNKKKTTALTAGKMEAKGRDAEDDARKKVGNSRAMKLMYQMDAKEVSEALREADPNYVPTIEDEIERERAKLKERLQKEGSKGTPVTPESFQAWKDRKEAARKKAAAAAVSAELKKKKGGKGLSVLTGRDLYAYKKELFETEDDADAVAVVANNVQDADLFLEAGNDDLDDLLEDDEDDN